MVGSSFIFDLFGKSPIRPLQQHMAKVAACVDELVPYFEAVLAKDWKKATKFQADVSRLEDEADALKKQLRLHLPKGLFLPVSRRDLLEVLTMQDKIANQAKDIAGLVLGRRMEFPAAVGQGFIDYLKSSIAAVHQAQKAINELDELVETGFRGNEVELVAKMIKELDEIEALSDQAQVQIREALYKIEKELHPVDVMFYYQVIDWTGHLADLAQRVGSRLQLMLAR